MRTFRIGLAMGVIAGSLVALVPPSTASAACTDRGETGYSILHFKKSRLATSLKSDYLHGPGTITINRTKTVNVSTTGTLGFGGEADVIIAKVSQTESISLTLGASWSSTWIYSKPVPKGKTARLVLFHESRSFDVRKWRLDAHCVAQTVWTRHANAPRKSHAYNVWDLQYL